MKSLQVSVSFTVESEDDAKNVFAMLGALQKSGSTLAAAKPAAALASEPAPASKSKATKPKSAPEPVEEEEEDAEEEDAEEEEEEEEAPPAKSKIKVTDELRNATKLREVLSVLIDAGINSKKGLLKECLALKAKIPVLQRVQDLETRIPKAAELIKPDIGA